jgi:arylesterase/paraoxonase
MGTHNASAAGIGYIATYDPSSKKVTKLAANGFKSPRGLSPFGMDVVPSTRNPDELTIYVTNIRPPFVDLDPDLPPGIREAKRDEIASARAKAEGTDPSIEVFRHILGSDSMQHVKTWENDETIICPNDVVGLPDGKGFWFTNPLPYRTGIVRLDCSNSSHPPLMSIRLRLEQANEVSVLLQQKLSSIVFCGADGCKPAATGLYGINGIARSPFHSNDTFYVAHTFLGGVSLLTKQSDNRLLLDEHISTGEYT